MIEVRGLRKEYGRTVALDGLDLDVPAGGVFGFLGPNGSGKTTTIRCLLGLVRPTAGHCRVTASSIGSLIEGQGMFPTFSGRRNLEHLARVGHVRHPRVDEVLDVVGLADRGDDHVRTYSLGMRQRLGIAAALLKDPELLILDEPANGLDPEGIVEVRQLLRRLGDDGRTVFVSSHQLAEVAQLCDAVAVIARGRCVATGPIDEIAAPAIVLRIADAEAARGVLVAAGFDVHHDDGMLRVDRPPGDAPLVAKALADRGLYPSELRPAVDLEETFLALTRDER